MKVELQCGDTITIPEGCKATIKDGSVVFEREEKEQEFKDGDVLTSRLNNKFIFIFKEEESKQKDNRNGYYVCHKPNHIINVATKDKLLFCGYKIDVRPSTEEEKQQLFEAMKERGLQWNAEAKRVENIRRRIKEGDKYHYIFSTLEVSDTTYYASDAHRLRVENYNCFRTKEYTKEAARRVKETLRKYHEEIGE